jgi:hypothetical protein
MSKKNNTSTIPFIKVISIALLFCFGATMAHAKPQKYRGHILSVDHAAKTMVIEHKKSPGGKRELKWDDRTRLPGPAEFSDLAPGQWVRNVMNEPDDGFIQVIRRYPDQDKVE